MSVWMRRPESVRLELPDDQWIVVRKHLTAGDERRMFERMRLRGLTPDVIKLDPLLVSVSKITAYLLDWSVTDADDQRIDITGPDAEAIILAALDMLDPAGFRALVVAIDQHEAAVTLEKKMTIGAPPSVLT